MTDIRTYTRQTAPPWAKGITDTILAGNLGRAREMWMRAAGKVGADRAIYAVAAVAEPDPGLITVGEAPLVFGNPLRQGFAWRCGECLHIFRRGGPDPHAGVNYKTLRGASNAAHKHATEHHQGRVRVEELTR